MSARLLIGSPLLLPRSRFSIVQMNKHVAACDDVVLTWIASALRGQFYNMCCVCALQVAFEQRIDEHRLLQAHLQALERSEQNGPLLMPDEVMFSDILWSPADNNTTAIGGTGNPSLGGGGAAARRMYTAPRSTSIAQGGGGGGASLQPMPSGARAVSRYLSMPNQLTRFVGGRFPYAGYGGAESTGRRSQHSSEVEQGVDPGDDGSASAAASAAAEPQEAGGAFSVAGAASSAPVKGTGRGWWGDRRLGGRGLLGRRRTAPVSSRQRARDLSLQQSGFATGSGAGAIVSGGGGVRADLSHMRSSFETWGGGGGGGAESHRSVTGELISDVGGQPHVLKWSEWLERQRARGWYSSETLYFMTALGAVMGAGNFTSFWSQLQIWEGMLFIVPYCFNFFTIGVPAMQTEVCLVLALFSTRPRMMRVQRPHSESFSGLLDPQPSPPFLQRSQHSQKVWVSDLPLGPGFKKLSAYVQLPVPISVIHVQDAACVLPIPWTS